MAKEQYVVTIVRPSDVTVTDMKDYIEDAVASWMGQYNPQDDPRFWIDPSSVKVKRLTTKKGD